LSPTVDPVPSWKTEHPADEEQMGVQWTLYGKAEEIASRHQSLMDCLTPLYAAKVPAIDQESPTARRSDQQLSRGAQQLWQSDQQLSREAQ
jgi:hypothetical protein